VAVADVQSIYPRHGPFCYTVTGRKDQVIILEVKTLDCSGEQWKITSVLRAGEGKVLNERCVDLPLLDDRGNASFIVKKGKELGIGIEFAENLEAFLPTSHASEPIMDKGYAHENSFLQEKTQ